MSQPLVKTYTLENAKEHLSSLLDLMKINKVFFVDDSLNTALNVDELKGLLVSIHHKGYFEAIKDEDLPIDFNEDIDSYTDDIVEKWNELKAVEQIKYFDVCYKILGEKENFTNINVSSALKDFFQEGILILLTPIQWEEYINTFDGSINILVLFDQNLTKDGGEFVVKKGQDLILDIKKRGLRHNIIPGLFTYTIEKIDEEIEKRIELLKEFKNQGEDISSEDFFVFTKERLQKNNLFVDAIKQLFLNQYVEKIKNETIKLSKNALRQTIATLNTIDTYSFDLAILKSSLTEGIWEAQTLLRIINIHFEDFIKKQMIDSNYLLKTNIAFAKAHSISQSCIIPLEGEVSPPYLKPIEIRKKEIYESGEIINKLHKPIENGDIFEITDAYNKKHLYILIAQDCDLMLRTNGKRKLETATLLYLSTSKIDKLEKEEKDAFESAKKKKQSHTFWSTRFKVEYYENDQVGVVKFTHNPLVVNLSYLDITSFNSSGEIKLKLNQSEPTTNLSASLKKRESELLSSIKQEIKEIREILKNLPKKGERYKKIYPKICPDLVALGNIKVPAVVGNNDFSFNVKRVKRLRQPYSGLLLEKYLEYLTRNAEQHDFAKEI